MSLGSALKIERFHKKTFTRVIQISQTTETELPEILKVTTKPTTKVRPYRRTPLLVVVDTCLYASMLVRFRIDGMRDSLRHFSTSHIIITQSLIRCLEPLVTLILFVGVNFFDIFQEMIPSRRSKFQDNCLEASI